VEVRRYYHAIQRQWLRKTNENFIRIVVTLSKMGTLYVMNEIIYKPYIIYSLFRLGTGGGFL